MTKFKILVSVILTVFSINTQAQKITSSIYSRFGVGDLTPNSFSRSTAMGNAFIGSRTHHHINIGNPASYSAIFPNQFLFEFGMNFKYTQYDTETTSQTDENSSLNYLALAFPITKYWASSIGFKPYSGIGYQVNTTEMLTTPDDTTNITFIYAGDGGLNQVHWGNSFKYKQLAVGINAYFLFGNIEKRVDSEISETTFYQQTQTNRNILMRGFSFGLGAQYTDTIKSKIDVKKNKLIYTIGAVYGNETNLKTHNTILVRRYMNINGGSMLDTLINDTISSGKVFIPNNFGFGFSLKFYDKLTIAADYYIQNWKEAKLLELNEPLVNSSSINFGIEYCREYYSTRYFRTLRYRLGGYYTNTNLKINDIQLKDYGLTFGIGLPVKNSVFNLGFYAGKRGTTESNLIKEQYYGANVCFSLSDLWFVKRKFM